MSQKLTLCLLLLSLIGFSQAPQLINYQGVARDANGTPIVGTIGLKFELRQGSASSPTVFAEAQTLTTGNLGVFSTQIGKVPGSNFNNVNWQSGSLFLEVSITLSGGTYTSLGTQQLVSVPFSMLAQSVPASYTNNVLTIGSQVFTLAPATGAIYTASTGIAITSGSVITNTAPDVPITFTSTNSAIAVTGPYPNFSLSYTPTPAPTSLTLGGAANNSLSAGSNTVVLNTYTVGSGLNISGGPNYTITSSAITPTIKGIGVASVSSSGSSYTVNVPNPSITVAGTLLTLSQGTAVSTATLSSPALSLSGANNNSLTAGSNTVTLNTYTTGAGLAITGGPNYTISSTATAPSLTLLGTNNNSLTAGNNTVTLNTYTSGSGILVTGGPNYTISSAAPSLTLSGTNNNSLTAGNNTVTLNTYTTGAGLTISGGPNYTIASTAASPTIQGAGVAVVSPSVGSNFTVTVPNPSVTVTGTVLTLTQGASTSTVPLNSYAAGSGITIAGGGPNYTISSSAANPTIQGAGLISVSPLSGPAFTVSIPDPTISVSNTILTLSQGTVSSSVVLPTTSVTGSGAATVTPVGLTYNVNVASLSITATGATSLQGSYPSYTLNTPFPSSPTITGTGAAVVTPTTGSNFVVNVPLTTVTATTGIAGVTSAGTNSFNVNVPAPAYVPATGALNTGTATTNITQALTFTNNILTAGPSTNSVLIPASVNPSIFPAGSASVTGFFPSFTVSAPASPTVTGTGLAIVSPSTGASIVVNVPLLTYTSTSGLLGSGANTVDITSPLALNGTTLTSGPLSNSINLNGLSPFITSGSSIYQTSLSNSVGIGTNAPSAKLDIVESLTYTGTYLKVQSGNASNSNNLVDLSNIGTGNALNVFSNNTSTVAYAGMFDGGIQTKGKTTTTSGYAIRALNSLSTDLFVVRNDGNVGIGITSPLAHLHVSNSSATAENAAFEVTNSSSISHALVATSNSGNQYALRALNTSATASAVAGMFEGGIIGRGKNISTAYAFRAQNFGGADMFVIRNDGNVGINNAAPSATLDISGTMRLADGTQQLGRVLTSDASGNATWQTFSAWGLTGNAGTSSSTNFIGTTDNQALSIRTNSVDRVTVSAAGDIGIGTTTPATRLHVHNAASNFVQARFTHTATTSFGLVISTDNLSAAFLNYDNTPLYFGTNGANRLVISSTGSVGIGNMSPTARLDVAGTVKIADGTEGANKVLTSDASGNTSWQQVGVPTGAVMAYAGATVPTGWLICDGTSYARTGTYANLFAAIGTSWGAPSGTTFNVPDMRGMFLRGVDAVAGNDPDKLARTANNTGGNTGNNVGSEQTDEFENHNHSISPLGNTVNVGLLGTAVYTPGGSSSTGNTGGSTETRPKNVYVYYIIKM